MGKVFNFYSLSLTIPLIVFIISITLVGYGAIGIIDDKKSNVKVIQEFTLMVLFEIKINVINLIINIFSKY